MVLFGEIAKLLCSKHIGYQPHNNGSHFVLCMYAAGNSLFSLCLFYTGENETSGQTHQGALVGPRAAVSCLLNIGEASFVRTFLLLYHLLRVVFSPSKVLM